PSLFCSVHLFACPMHLSFPTRRSSDLRRLVEELLLTGRIGRRGRQEDVEPCELRGIIGVGHESTVARWIRSGGSASGGSQAAGHSAMSCAVAAACSTRPSGR